jgi:hypothetical protein
MKLKQIMIAMTVLLLACGVCYGDLNDGLVAYYPFDGNANDESGNGNDGTEYNGVTYIYGIKGGAAGFEGVDDYIEIPHSTTLEPSVFSISLWVKTLKSTPGSHILNTNDQLSCNHGYNISQYIDGRIGFAIDQLPSCGDDVVSIGSDESINDGNWHHVVVVYNSTMSLYVDSILQKLKNTANYAKTGRPIRIGNALNNNEKIFQGSIDEIRFYNRVLTQSEIHELYDEAYREPSIVQNSYNDHWYKKILRERTWSSANSYCNALGGYLTSLTSKYENDFVYYNLGNYGAFHWAGGTDEHNEGIWVWINGESWDYSNWAPGEPNDHDLGQDYLVLKNGNRWADGGLPKFNVKYPFICEWDSLDDLANLIIKTDLDQDNVIDGSDLSILLNSYGESHGSPNFNSLADVNDDGIIDNLDLIAFSYKYGSMELPLVLNDTPAYNQNEYQFIESVNNIKAGGCVPVSFSMMYIGHYNRFGPNNVSVDTSAFSDNTIGLMDDIAINLSTVIGENEWWDFFNWTPQQTAINENTILLEMTEYTFTFDSPDYFVTSDWEIDYFNAKIISNDQLINFFKEKLSVDEPILFLANITGMGNHASVITGYMMDGGTEYIRINDTWENHSKWYVVRRDGGIQNSGSSGTIYNPIKIYGDGLEWVLQYSVANPKSLNFTVVPKI